MFSIDLKSNVPIYEQIINHIKENILKGYLKKGDPLPSVRKLSALIDVNPNTIAKAYQELERQGVIVTLRGKGTFVAEEIKNNIDLKCELDKIRPSLAAIKLTGADDNEIIEGIKEILRELNKTEE